jgi:hypothetical protein
VEPLPQPQHAAKASPAAARGVKQGIGAATARAGSRLREDGRGGGGERGAAAARGKEKWRRGRSRGQRAVRWRWWSG